MDKVHVGKMKPKSSLTGKIIMSFEGIGITANSPRSFKVKQGLLTGDDIWVMFNY